MLTGESINNNNNTEEQNPWQKMADEMPPFGEHDTAETAPDENAEYIDINEIDISTDEGKSEWLDSLVSNAITRAQEDLAGVASLDDEQIGDATSRLHHAERQQMMLDNLFNNTSDGSILDRLRENYEKYSQFNANLPANATDEAKQLAYENYQAASDLLSIMESEMAQRDSNYFGESEMKIMLSAQVDQAKKVVDDSMVKIDGYFGEDGFVHQAPNDSEKQPTAAAEDAEIDLREAKQDAETFNKLMQDYHATTNYQTPIAISKADFAPTITNFIETCTAQINQLLEASNTLVKGTPEYTENAEMRKKLARERSSARRLSERYFFAPDISSDINDGMAMEETPSSKTPGQIEAEKAKKRHKEDTEFKQRMQEYMKQRDAEQTQREQAERTIWEREQAETERHKRIKDAQEKVHQVYQQQEQEDKQEMEM